MLYAMFVLWYGNHTEYTCLEVSSMGVENQVKLGVHLIGVTYVPTYFYRARNICTLES